jgi:hypothetical protein
VKGKVRKMTKQKLQAISQSALMRFLTTGRAKDLDCYIKTGMKLVRQITSKDITEYKISLAQQDKRYSV